MGNPILLKPAHQCPESAEAIQQMHEDAGFPRAPTRRSSPTNEQIETVIEDPRVRGVSLTGSERAGAAVAEIAGRNLKKVVLELGGSDPFVLLGADDLDEAVDAAVAGRLDNTGQSCNAAKRFIVADELYDDFLEKFTAKMTASEPGDPTSEDAAMGPLSSAEAAETLQEQLDRAVAQGAEVAAGGERNGQLLPQHGADRDHAGQRCLPRGVLRPGRHRLPRRLRGGGDRAGERHAVRPGLVRLLQRSEQAQRVADGLDTGMVYVNGVGLDGAELPFGGVKNSGFGRELGKYGIEEFVNKKLIRVVKWAGGGSAPPRVALRCSRLRRRPRSAPPHRHRRRPAESPGALTVTISSAAEEGRR